MEKELLFWELLNLFLFCYVLKDMILRKQHFYYVLNFIFILKFFVTQTMYY